MTKLKINGIYAPMNKIAVSPKFHYTVSFVAFMTGLAIPLHASGVAPEQAALGMALLAALLIFVRSPDSRRWFTKSITSPEAKAIAAIFVAWSITIFFSTDPIASIKMAARTGLFLVASLVIGSVLFEQHQAQRLLWKTLIVSAIALTLAAALSLNGVPMIISALKGKIIMGERPVFAFKAFGATVLCLIPVIAWAGRKLGRHWWWSGFVYTPLALSVIFLTNNRSALAGLMAMTVATALLIIIAKRRNVRLLMSASAATITTILAWLYTKEFHTPLLENSYLPEWLIDPHRQSIWRFAFNQFVESPWVGNGIDQLNRLAGASEHVAGLNSSAAMVPSHPHNWGLEILSETGLIGFLPMLFALGFIAWRLIKNYLASHDEADIACLALMVGFWSSALFNFSIWASWWQLTFFILFASIACSRIHSPSMRS